MKRFFTLLTVVVTCLALFAPTAEAKRFGGGGSFGKQRAVPMQRQAQKAPQSPPEKAPVSTPPAGNKWLGPLAGLAIGAGLASLFAGGGLGGSMGTILLALLAAGAVMFLLARFNQARTPAQPAMQYAGARPYTEPSPPVMSGGGAPASSGNIPADFPVEAFLRNGKTSFIRLQAANDRKDLDDIREYTTPEMFAEISMQIHERGNEPQKTDVLQLEAELLEVAEEGHYSIASVLFTGQLRENNGAPEAVREIWHVQKDQRDDKSVWLLAGIQQA